jgi:hypothetical protein
MPADVLVDEHPLEGGQHGRAVEVDEVGAQVAMEPPLVRLAVQLVNGVRLRRQVAPAGP